MKGLIPLLMGATNSLLLFGSQLIHDITDWHPILGPPPVMAFKVVLDF